MSVRDAASAILAISLGPSPDEESSEEPSIPAEIEMPIDDALETLANDRRRFAIRHVAAADRADSAVDVGTLAEGVASFENDVPPGQIDCQQRKRVYVALYQGHLKKLAAAGAVAIVRGDRNQPKSVGATGLTHDLDAVASALEDAFEGTQGPPCPSCGEEMHHALPAGGQAVPCGCEITGPATDGVTWG